MKQVMMFAAIVVVTLAVHANPTQLSNGLLASKEDRTLYVLENDAARRSNCNVIRGVSKKMAPAPGTGYSSAYDYH